MKTEQSGNQNDFKYIMMDMSYLYLGARFSLGELMEEDGLPFKMKAVMTHYLIKDMDPATTLESQLYYLENRGFLYETLRQLRVKVKVNLLVEKKNPLQAAVTSERAGYQYKEKTVTLEQLTRMNLAQKKKQGVIVREMIVSRMGLMAFSV